MYKHYVDCSVWPQLVSQVGSSEVDAYLTQYDAVGSLGSRIVLRRSGYCGGVSGAGRFGCGSRGCVCVRVWPRLGPGARCPWASKKKRSMVVVSHHRHLGTLSAHNGDRRAFRRAVLVRARPHAGCSRCFDRCDDYSQAWVS